MGVLVAVIGFAIWQSVQQAAQQDNYAAGVQAMTQHNWEEAQARFAAASGYHDADRQAQVVAGKITDRDRQYDFATDYMTNERWVECLDAVRQVQDIQPGYKDSAEIEKQALYQAKLDSLTSTIALRPNASPPGLYFYDRTGWVHLPQSDAYSAVQSYTPDGHVIYDVPGEGWQPSASPTPQPGRVNPASLQGRVYMLLQLRDLTSARPLTIDPAIYNVISMGKEGVWALENTYGNSGSRILPVRESFSGYEAGKFIYQDYTSTLTSTLEVSGKGDSAIMAIDPNSDHYLLADWANLAPANTITPDTITTLYVGWPGIEPIPRYSIKGGSFISAQFSPDGQHALLSTYTPFTRTTEKQTMLLIDLGGGQASRKLGEVIAVIDPTQPYNTAEFSWLTATFVQSGPFAGQVLLAEFDVDHYHLRLFDTTTRAEPSIDVQVPTGSKIDWSAFPSDNDTLLVAGQDSRAVLLSNTASSLRFVAITPTNQSPPITRMTVRVTAFLDDAAILSGRLIYSIYDYGGAPDSQHSRSVLTLPLDHFSVKGRRPETTYKEIIPDGQYLQAARGAYTFRPGTFAYITANALHARTYSGDVDVTLEPSVTRLYNPDLFLTNRSWLH
jgi:hypothetical protein